MNFQEVKRSPEFTLTLTLQEAINLWRIVNSAASGGNEIAKPFVDALYEFASNSNSYDEDLAEDIDDINTWKALSIWQMAQHLEHAIKNDLVHEDTNVVEFVEKYLR